MRRPTLPRNIRHIRITSETGLRDGVRPSVKPTVQKADAHSKIAEMNGTSSMTDIVNEQINMRVSDKNTSAKARSTVSCEILRFITIASFLPQRTETVAKKRTAMVFVLIPPAVEPEEPPMNMRITITIFEDSVIRERSIVLKPAVLGDTD